MADKSLHDTAAALFVDALGRDLPWRSHFSFKDLHDFLRREGIFGLDNLDGSDLVKIASTVGHLTTGNVTINAEPVATATVRTPLSSVDLRAAGYACPAARSPGIDRLPREGARRNINALDRVTLNNGTQLNVVAIGNGRCVGVDDTMKSKAFLPKDVVAVSSMDDPIRHAARKCEYCGIEGTDENPAKHADDCPYLPERFYRQLGK